MLCKDIIKTIEETYPVNYAMEWDNVGLLAGRADKIVHRIYVALDATDEVIEQAISCQADMLITHHPLIFGGMKSVTTENFIGARLIRLIQSDISYYAIHTNYDVLGMAELSGTILQLQNPEILEVTSEEGQPEGIGRVANLKEPVSLKACCQYVKERFHLDSVKVFGDLEQSIQRVAISPGSGKSMITAALEKQADVLITGDIDHHAGIDAVAQHLTIIDAGHYGIEYIFIEDMKQYLQVRLEAVDVQTAPIRHPFQII